MKKTLCFLVVSLGLYANPYLEYATNQKIGVQNSILAKVNGKTISMMDVKKKMDLLFHQNYPQLIESPQARFQFYEMSWKQILREMIDNELMISDALDKEIKLTDGDVRETMEERFGPNVIQTLDKIGLTYDEAWKMVKNELIVQRMSWWFIHSKAVNSVTPQDIKQAYRLHLKDNPAYSEWKYQVISIRTEKADDMMVDQIYETLVKFEKSPTDAKDILKNLETPEVNITVSNEFAAKSHDLSEVHQAALENLSPGSYSKPLFQVSRADKKAVYRIFYLVDKTDHPAPAFESIAQQLKNTLIQKAIVQESDVYLNKLRKFYGFDGAAIPEDLQPFSLQ